jgi:glycerol-3-phosphate acyltransferase PlsX
MKIVVDAMGGDHAPGVVVAGVVAEARLRGTQVILVGVEDQVRAELAKHPGAADLPIEVVHASEVVGMAEHTMAVKAKKDSSMMVGIRLVKEGRAQAFASAGNSPWAASRASSVRRSAASTPPPPRHAWCWT